MRDFDEARPSRILFLMGQDRSGSTILGQVLGRSDGFAHVGEVRNVWRSGLLHDGLCSCGRPVRKCDLWSRAVPQALGGETGVQGIVEWLDASLRMRNLRQLLSAPAGVPRRVQGADAYAEVAAVLYPALLRMTGARVLVDSSKHPAYGALLATVPGLDVRFVHLVRDPRATAYSWGRELRSPGRPGGFMWRMPAWRAARAWVLANLAADRVRDRHPRRSMLVRYEDAMAAPETALARMARLAGEGGTTITVPGDRTVAVGGQHAAAGNPVRLETGRVELREDDAWRTGQRVRDRLVVMALTAPLLRRYGYRFWAPSGART